MEKNKNGPIILPVQYPINMIELVVAFFVYPATLEAIKLMLIGREAEKAGKRNIPPRRDSFFSGST